MRSCTALLMVACAIATGRVGRGQDAVLAPDAAESVEIPVPLLERSPFDRITLDASNDNAVIETVLLEFPNRRLPNPIPTSGTLEIRRLSHPSIPYAVQWSGIAKIELFEQMLLAEAEQLTAAGKFSEAFNYLAFLTTNYPSLPGLEAALQSHLWREASTAYAAGDREQAWPALYALAQRNANFPRLATAVQAVSDDLIAQRLKSGDYAAARTLVESLSKGFPGLKLANVARWQSQFQRDAQTQLDRARAALAAKEYSEAREAVAYARSIMPTVAGGAELWKAIQETAPEIRVGVSQLSDAAVTSQTPTWAAARVSDLVNPRLAEMVDFGAEGGVYRSRWCEIRNSGDGLATIVAMNLSSRQRGLRPETLALQLVEMANPADTRYQADFASLAASVKLLEGRHVEVSWRHPHVRPESFFQIPLRWLTTAEQGPGLWFDPLPPKREGSEQPYERTGGTETAPGEPRMVVELTFSDDEAAIESLTRGDIDAIDRVPPWQLSRLERSTDVAVVPYRLPTVHVLIPNMANPLMDFREFRRALNYGIDGESIVRDILLGGETRAGFRTLSGPFPAGVGLNDPGGYAYNQELAVRPYEPRLAALLASVARKTLLKRDEEAKKAAAAEAKKAESGADKTAPASGEAEAEGEKPAEEPAAESATKSDAEKKEPPTPLVLAHASDPVAKLACQSIKIQLDQIGIPVKLAEFKGGMPPADLKYDLLYAELAVWEPIYNARRLLGSNGVAGRASALMAAALDQLDQAENWNQARAQLQEIHRIAHYDLPVIPLWQTVNYFAHRKSVSGVGTSPVTLYQNLSAWRKSYE